MKAKIYECINGHESTIGELKERNGGESHGSGYAVCPECGAGIRPFP